MRTFPFCSRRQNGQALAEMIVVALFFLVPLFLAIVALGKFTDVQHTTQMAARYAAWERTVWYEAGSGRFDDINAPNRKSAAQINAEIAARVFNDRSRNTSVIADTDRNATGFVNGTDPLWRDNAGVVFLRDFQQAGSALGRSRPRTDVAGAAFNLVGGLSLPPGVVGTLVPPLPADTMASATVSLREMARDSQAYQRLWPRAGVWVDDWAGLDFSATGAVVSNTWGANGSGGTKGVVALSVPTAQGLGTLVGTTVNAAILTWDPLMPKVDLGRIEVDVVPEDRLR
ncbi:hypothetical protein [Massilia consociata]